MSDGKRETLADIVAEIRAYGSQPPPRLMWLEIADRIEDALKRERESVTNSNQSATRRRCARGRRNIDNKPKGEQT